MLFKNVLHAARVAALAAEKPLYAVTGGRLAKGRFLSAVPTEKIGPPRYVPCILLSATDHTAEYHG